MATTYTFPETSAKSESGYYGYLRLKLTCTNGAGTTSVKCELQGLPRYSPGVEAEVQGSISITISGVTKSLSLPETLKMPTASGEWTTIYTQTLTFTRTSANENMSVIVSGKSSSSVFKLYKYYGGVGPKYAVWDVYDQSKQTYSYTAALPEIGLNSTFDSIPTSATTLTAFTVKAKRNNTSYRNVITFYDKAKNKAVFTTARFGDSISVTPARAWLANTTDKSSITIQAKMTTYASSSSSTVVGSVVSAEFTLNADSGMKPVISSVALSYVNAGTAAAAITGYLQGYSKVLAAFSVNSSATEGAALSYEVKLENVTTKSSSANVTTSKKITGSGELTIVCTVNDSRGRSDSKTMTIQVIAYQKPTLEVKEAYHSDEDGNEDENGNCIALKATAGCSPIDGDQNEVTLKAKIGSGSEIGLTSGVREVTEELYSPDSGYTVTFTATDSLGNTTTIIEKIGTRIWAMQFYDRGQGVAFGKAAERAKELQVPVDWTMRIGENEIAKSVNGKHGDVVLSAADVGARADTWMPSASDVGARANTWTPTAAQVGAVPTTRKINGNALSSDITLDASDVGAVAIVNAGTVTTSAPVVITHTGTCRYLLIASSATSSRCSVALCVGTDTTAMAVKILSSSTTTFTTSGNKLTVKSTSGNVTITLLVFSGVTRISV